jgi:tetratricopeptide (TPR) repeat protein
MGDWYRRKSWKTTDAEKFFLRLGRAEKNDRAQYLRIQAIELVETKHPALLEAAEGLLNKMLTEYPEDNFNKASALDTLGDIYKLKNNYIRAVDYYKQALDFERIYPDVQTQAYLDYAELIVKLGRFDLFGDVKNLLLERYSGIMSPTLEYKVNSILSIIHKYEGRSEEAKQFAEIAEQFATAETSCLRNSKYSGIAIERDAWLDRLVRE